MSTNLLFIFFLFSFSVVRSDYHDQSDCLKVSPRTFLTSLNATMDQLNSLTSFVTKLVKEYDDIRLSNAIADCVELLDYTLNELSLAQSSMMIQKSNSKGDLKAWLSAALGNQETCMEGFEGTGTLVKNVINIGLEKITSKVATLLGMLRLEQVPAEKLSFEKFPSWMKVKDRRLLQQGQGGVSAANVVVACDGSGSFSSVMDAVLAAPDYSTSRYVIYVKKGVYKENVDIKKKKWNLMIIGDGMGVTVVSGNRNFMDGWTTFRSATFAVAGRGFIARDISFENTAGPEKHQAVAFRSDSDLSAFYRCGFSGYQDTLYAHSLRQFYRECRITGTIDFIFGNGAVVLQKCQILARKGLVSQKKTISAQGRKDPNQSTGFSFQFCNISAEDSNTYLGRPWKPYSRTVFMQSYMSRAIRPEGWLEWQGNFALSTLYYAEYMNYGPGAGAGGRVKWPGYHQIDSTQAATFTVAQLIDGNSWLPPTGVKYTAGLTV